MSTTLSTWLPQYEATVKLRLKSGEITNQTVGDYRRMIAFCSSMWGSRLLSGITVAEITEAVHAKAVETPHAARRIRILMSNMFLEAQRHGIVPHGYNPALISRWPLTRVSTERLTLDEWRKIFRCAQYRAPDYFQAAMLLAIVTGQRRADISKMHSDDIRAGYLHITQQKTGERIALPLSLQLDAISCTIEDVLSLCSPQGFLIQCRGRQVNVWSLTKWFQNCREEAGITASEGNTPPTFREQRSLSERLYRQQGIDTMTLLGHKTQKMTDRYNDVRGKEYRRLKA